MNNVRQLSLSCTAKKISYRQTNAGLVVAFLIHHSEMPDALATADLGTPYMMALVEIDDNDQPATLRAAAQRKEPAPVSEPLPGRVAAVQRAGYLCKEPTFQTFLKEEFAGGWKLFDGRSADDYETAIKFVRWRCGVKSRAEIKTNDEAFARWSELDAHYQAWLRE